MKKTLVLAALLAVVAAPGTVFAADAMDSKMAPAMDCKTAPAMMKKAMMAAPPAMSGNMDKDTHSAMMAEVNTAMAMAKVEVACGKDDKAKAAAQAYIDTINKWVNDFTTHQ